MITETLKDLTNQELRLSKYSFAEIRDSALDRRRRGLAEFYNEIARLIDEEIINRKEKLKIIEANLLDADTADTEWTAEVNLIDK